MTLFVVLYDIHYYFFTCHPGLLQGLKCPRHIRSIWFGLMVRIPVMIYNYIRRLMLYMYMSMYMYVDEWIIFHSTCTISLHTLDLPLDSHTLLVLAYTLYIYNWIAAYNVGPYYSIYGGTMQLGFCCEKQIPLLPEGIPLITMSQWLYQVNVESRLHYILHTWSIDSLVLK